MSKHHFFPTVPNVTVSTVEMELIDLTLSVSKRKKLVVKLILSPIKSIMCNFPCNRIWTLEGQKRSSP